MKLTKYRRLAATVAMVGAGSLAFLAPAVAHQQNGNPAGPADPVDGRHDVIVESGGVPKTVSLVRSKADGCAFNTVQFAAPACTTPSIIDISAPAFGGTGNVQATMLLCNGKRAAGTDAGGDDSPTSGCDFANARGLAGPPFVIVAGSGTFTEDGAGNLTGGVGGVPASGRIPVTLNSCNGGGGSGIPDLLTPLGGAMCTNSNTTTTCPPTQGQIAGGFTCIVTVAEFDGAALTAGDHVGFRQVNLKSPIPTKLCDPPGAPVSFGACAASISAGTAVQLTGVRFPCKVIQPDDPAVVGNQGSCLTAQTGKQILIKRNSTGLLEGAGITPTFQSAGVNGDYVVTFTMPTLLFPGELYKLVPHAADCVFNQGAAGLAPPNNWRVKTCESGKFNAAGPSVKQ